jgi:hypothetical protein
MQTDTDSGCETDTSCEADASCEQILGGGRLEHGRQDHPPKRSHSKEGPLAYVNAMLSGRIHRVTTHPTGGDSTLCCVGDQCTCTHFGPSKAQHMLVTFRGVFKWVRATGTTLHEGSDTE